MPVIGQKPGKHDENQDFLNIEIIQECKPYFERVGFA